ncbi:MAG: hypothetical protein ACYDBB_09840 [Armatimonadota bacterium]
MTRITANCIRWISLLVGLLWLSTLPVWAAPLVASDYAKPTRAFRVCLLLLDSQRKPGNAAIHYWSSDPWILPVLYHSPFKPGGWEMDNPLAPGVLLSDPELKAAGDAYSADPKGGSKPAPYPTNWYLNGKTYGDPLTKDDPAYWAVKLNEKSLDALASFDLIILNGHSQSTLSAPETHYLRYLLERGATIWVNNSQRTGIQIKNFFIDPPVVFRDDLVNQYKDRNGKWLIKADPNHWLLNAYYTLSDQEVHYLRDNYSAKDYILSGVAGYPGGENSLIHEVVRLTPAFQDANWTLNYAPALAAGRVGNGQIILTATDIIGATADWWEYRHNYSTLTDLTVWPYSDALHNPGTPLPNQHDRYMAASKLIFNMLARPVSWEMAGANPAGTRSYDKEFAKTLTRGWVTPFTTIGDPVSYGNYVAVTGNPTAALTGAPPVQVPATELRVYRTRRITDNNGTALDYPYGLNDEYQRLLTPSLLARQGWWNDAVEPDFPNDATADSEMDRCFTITRGHWVGSPVFGKITENVTVGGVQDVITRTVLYALSADTDGVGNTYYYPHCFLIDPYIFSGTTVGVTATEGLQVGVDKWQGNLGFAPATAGVPRASMTYSDGRLVVTTFGKTSDTSTWRIYLLDGNTGAICAQVGSSPKLKDYFRLTGPASIVTAQIDYEANGLEAGSPYDAITQTGYNNSINNPNGMGDLRRNTIEVLVAPGEYYGLGNTTDVNGQPALFIIPPSLYLRVSPPSPPFTMIPPDLRLVEGSDPTTTDPNLVHLIGNQGSDFRKKYVLSVRTRGYALSVIFRTWDVFFKRGSALKAPLSLPLSMVYTPDRTSSYGTRPGQALTTVTMSQLLPSMGYPIILKGTKHFDTSGRLSLRVLDGDANTFFGYGVDAPPLVFRDQLIAGTGSVGVNDVSSLFSSMDTATLHNFVRGGTLSSFDFSHPGFSMYKEGVPMSYPWDGDIAWAFHGNTFGPKGTGTQSYFWFSDFPFPASAGKDTIYTVATYRGRADDYEGVSNFVATQPADPYRGMLYALDPYPSYYLRQVVTAGGAGNDDPTAAGYNANTTILVDQTMLAAALRAVLRVGARAMLRGAPGTNPSTWDLGTVTAIRNADVAGKYWVTFDRYRPGIDINGYELLVTTSIPYVSHVRAWNNFTGEEPLRLYTTPGNTPAIRLSEGICNLPKDRENACPDPHAPETGTTDTMISLSGLEYTCHSPSTLAFGPVINGNQSYSLQPQNDGMAAGWTQTNFIYIPRVIPVAGKDVNLITGATNVNYSVDHRTGRFELSPKYAGEFADRFVVVHYFTQELIAGVNQRVRHAEIMYIPSQIKWQYQFPDATPDSGPVLVNDTLYVTAHRWVPDLTAWQPTLYAFAAHPQNPLNVQPLWSQPIGETVDNPAGAPLMPYRGITTPVPTPNGILVGTALLRNPADTGKNELSIYSDRGTLIADGQRLLRINSDGQVTWNASATVDFDPAALRDGDPTNRQVGVSQQGFTLITRMHTLPNGNILVCDTGANRVVELNRQGVVVWQYPDSDLTYQDPDRDAVTGNTVRLDGVLNTTIRKVTPADLRINGPRDVRRYSTEYQINPAGIPVFWNGVNVGSGTIRWETTVIADAGKNRIIEVYRPLVRLDAKELGNTVFAFGFHYRPDYYYMYNGNQQFLRQFSRVIVDGAALKLWNGKTLNQTINFTAALRYPGPDNRLLAVHDHNTNADWVQENICTKELLVAVGNPMKDPDNQAPYLRTLRISVPITGQATLRNFATAKVDVSAGMTTFVVDYSPEFQVGDAVTIHDGNTVEQSLGTVQTIGYNPGTGQYSLTVTTGPTQNFNLNPAGTGTNIIITRVRNNALAIRPGTEDYNRIWQLDTVTLHDPVNNVDEVHALVVDQTGAREVPTTPGRQDQPVFEMAQKEYADAFTSGWWTKLKTGLQVSDQNKLNAWMRDNYFAPVAMLRIDGSNGTTLDPRNARYLISQVNTTASTDNTAWINGKAERRIHLFEVRWIDKKTAYVGHEKDGWGIIDADQRYFIYPDPLSSDFPNLPGWTYPLTQPFCIDRD